jgi:hypothetical protein
MKNMEYMMKFNILNLADKCGREPNSWAAEGTNQKKCRFLGEILRQKDRILTDLWKAFSKAPKGQFYLEETLRSKTEEQGNGLFAMLLCFFFICNGYF